MTPRWDL